MICRRCGHAESEHAPDYVTHRGCQQCDCATFAPVLPVTEWQCTCGAWIGVGWSMHQHVETKQATLAEMHEMRRAIETGLLNITPDVLDRETVVPKVFRTKGMPTR